MTTSNPMRFALLVVAGALATSLGAQTPEPKKAVDERALMKQIQQNMQRIEDELSKLKSDPSNSSQQTADDIDRLMKKLSQRQDQVAKDLQQIVDSLKSQGGGGGGGGGQSQSKGSGMPKDGAGKSRDRNSSDQGKDKPQGGKQPKDGQKPTGKQDKKGQKPNGGKPEDNTAQNPDGGANKKGGLPDAPREKAKHVNVEDVWGVLPPEIRQKLVDRNFGDFTPEYEDEVKEYLKRTNMSPTKN